MLSIKLLLHVDELVQLLEIGKTVIVVGVPLFESSRKVVTLEACVFSNANI